MFDYRKLNGRIIEKAGSKKRFAQMVGLSENSVSRKLSQKRPIKTEEIVAWSAPDILDIPPEEYPEYFFKEKED